MRLSVKAWAQAVLPDVLPVIDRPVFGRELRPVLPALVFQGITSSPSLLYKMTLMKEGDTILHLSACCSSCFKDITDCSLIPSYFLS